MADRFLPAACLLACMGCATSGGEKQPPLDVHLGLASSYLTHNNARSAMPHVLAALKIDPDSARALYLLGSVHVEQGLTEEAELSFRDAIEIDGNFADAYSALGVLLDRDGRHDEAEQMHRRALELVADRVAFHNNLGYSLFLQGEYVEAVKSYRAAIRLGGSGMIHNNLGFAYGHLGHPQRAFREFLRAGTKAEAFNNMGVVYELLGDEARAAECYSRAVKLAPALAGARKNLDGLARKRSEGSDKKGGS